MVEQDCTRVEEECDRNVTTKLNVGTTYLIAPPLANRLLKQNLQGVRHIHHFNFKNVQLTVIKYLSAYITSTCPPLPSWLQSWLVASIYLPRLWYIALQGMYAPVDLKTNRIQQVTG